MSTPTDRRRANAKWIGVALAAFAVSATAAAPFELLTRSRVETEKGSGVWKVEERKVSWDPQKTAVVVCDMWDRHWCQGATKRVAEMAPRMNELLKAARARGALIIHCPSDTMEFYEGAPQRDLARSAPKPEKRPQSWKGLDPQREAPLPIDDSDGGCDDWPQCKQGKAWSRQIATLEVEPGDAVTDSDEAYSLMRARGITNVMVMGVHLNMCVLGRPFSIRQMVSHGQNVVLVRDLTDTMYNSRMRPFVSHFAGTDLMIEHVEKYWCPSITSASLLGGEPFRFKDDRRPRVTVLIGEDEYRTWETLPAFASEALRWRGVETRVVHADPNNKHRFPDLIPALKDSDALLVSVRRRALPEEQLRAIREFIAAGKPVVAIRTASHAFAPRGDDESKGAAWPEFDGEVLGGNYHGHHGNGPVATISVADGAAEHPALTGVEGFSSVGSLYRVRPLSERARPLLIGTIPGQEPEPVAWALERGNGRGRVFYTSLGHPRDFEEASFRRLLVNGIVWALDLPMPPANAPVESPGGRDAEVAGAVRGNQPAAAAAAAAAAAESGRIRPEVAPLPPEESARRFTVMDGLEMELLLSEPEIAQPVHISFDERGRLWLVEYRQYPAPAGLTLLSHDQFWRAVYDKVPAPPPRHVRGKDRISIHEDTDGDGVYDKRSVFVDGLNIATAVAKGRGGVWVLNPPYLLFYPDRDGDDRPDGDPEVRLQGFGLEDTHSVANSLRWGPDGWLYAAQGSTVSGRVRRPEDPEGSETHSLGQNIWRYHPEQRRYEIFAEGGGNAFGVEIDNEGRIFSGHNGGNTRGFHYVQGGYLQKGFEKHGELSNPYAFGYFPPMAHHNVERFTHTFVFYSGGAFSGRFDGLLFGVEPMQGRVVISEARREGATFRTRDVGHAVTSADPWFKPVDIKHGPDGALYVADWHDYQINHWRNYQGNMDASNGRVYRLKARGAKPARPQDLGRLTSDQLVDLLGHPNQWTRQTALRLLGDRRDTGVVPRLERLLREEKGQMALEALWALNLSGGLNPERAALALRHANPRVREWCVRLLGDSGEIPAALGALLMEMACQETDLETRVQLAATAKRVEPGLGLAIARGLMTRDEDAKDARQPLMIWWALEAHAGRDREAVVGLLKDSTLWGRPLVAEHLLERLTRRFAAAGQPRDLDACAQLFRLAPDEASRARLLAGFEKAFENRSMAGLPANLIDALAEAEAEGGSLALKARLGRKGALELAARKVEDENAKPGERAQLIQTLGELRDARALPALLAASGSPREEVAVAAWGALRQFEDPKIVVRAIEAARAREDRARQAALLLLASRAGSTRLLLDAAEGGALSPAIVSREIVTLLERHDDPEIARRVNRLWGQKSGNEAPADAKLARFAEIVRGGGGDPFAGRQVFMAACGACHRLFNQGGDLGPDLTPFRRDDLDSMLLSIVQPSAEIREGYENYLLDTRDDRALAGFIVRSDERVVVLRGLDGQDVAVPRDEIADLRRSEMSLMPEGLLDGMQDEEIRNLFAYLRISQPLVN